MFLIKMDFCKPKVIHGLDLNFSLANLRGGWLSKIALILLKNY